jgi:NTP pyrophosphatase (non-canonical NTP hydrolase)
MTEHFETLWEKSEVIAESFYSKKEWDDYDVIAELQENLILLKRAGKDNDQEAYGSMIGEILFNISYLSKKANINTHAALKERAEDIKIEMLDPDIDNTDG